MFVLLLSDQFFPSLILKKIMSEIKKEDKRYNFYHNNFFQSFNVFFVGHKILSKHSSKFNHRNESIVLLLRQTIIAEDAGSRHEFYDVFVWDSLICVIFDLCVELLLHSRA